jgi:site-specific DNA recombinase
VPAAAAIYARISSDPEHDELGVRRQVADCEAWANRNGWPVREVYIDNDISAWSGKRRPRYQDLLADLAAGDIDGVIVWAADRLHRHPRELEDYIEVCGPRSIPTATLTATPLDLTTSEGRLTARILGAVARSESDTKSRRIQRKHQELAEAGKLVGGGTRPYGYLADRRSLNPDEAPFVREAAARVVGGDSLRSVAADFNARGIRTVSGRPWSTSVLARILQSARISARREHHGEITAAGDWQAIISADESDRLRAILHDPARRTNRTARRYLLAGLLRCGLCGATLVARPRSDDTRRYVCAKGPGLAGCGGIAIVADPVEQLIAEATVQRLDTPELAATLAGEAAADEALRPIQIELGNDQAQLEQLATAWADRQITFGEYLAARKPIERRIEAARRRLTRSTRSAAIGPYIGESAALRERWPDLPLPRQQAIVSTLVDRAVIGPAVRGRTTFDPSRVSTVWRL